MDELKLDILYEDGDVIAVNKPAGLLTHPSWLTKKGTLNVASMLKEYLNNAAVHTVHRLDRATSGVLLIAKNKRAAQCLSADFAAHTVQKSYLCVVRGYAPEEGVIDYPLKYKHDKKAEPFALLNQPAQSAVTHFQRLSTIELPISVGKWPTARYSLLRAMPRTGRKHQLRRHFKHILCPIVGDTNYGEGRHNVLFRRCFQINRLLLMATDITFIHPSEFKKITIRAPLSVEVSQLFVELGWEKLIDH